MTVLKNLLCLALLLLIPSGPAFAQRSRLGASLPRREVLDRYGLKRAWWSRATLDPQRDRVRYITVDEQLVYIQTRAGFVTAFDNETGRRLWSSLLGNPDDPSHPLSSNEEIVAVVRGLDFYAVEKYTGKVLWNIRTPSSPSTGPVMDNERAYVGFLDGSVYAFNLAKVRELFSEGRLPEWSFQTIAWRYATSKEVAAPPLSNGKVVNFASLDGSLYTVTADEREMQFQFETDAPISAPIAESGQFLYMASEDFNFYCLDRSSGKVIWEFVSGLPVRSKPRVIGKHVFLLPVQGGLHCLSSANGERLWWRPNATNFLAASTQVVYTSDRFGNVVLNSREDGAVLSAIPLRQFTVRLSNDRTDRMYFATPDGLIVCLHEKDREFPIFHLHPERRPIVPEFAPEQDSETPQNNAAGSTAAGTP